MESAKSDGRIISGQLFTAFDEETKGTRSLAFLAKLPCLFKQVSADTEVSFRKVGSRVHTSLVIRGSSTLGYCDAYG